MLQLNPVLNTAIGLVLTFAAMSMLTSALTEALASVLALRAERLKDGIGKLLNDPQLANLAGEVMRHPAVSPLANNQPTKPATKPEDKPEPETAAKPASGPSTGRWDKLLNWRANQPSYVTAAAFAQALRAAIKVRPDHAKEEVDKALAAIADEPLRNFLTDLWKQAQNDVNAFEALIATWFDSAMDQLSGAYKRYAQLINFALALLLAGLMNVDAFTLAQQLWASPNLTAAVQPVAGPDHYAEALAGWEKTFPYGWGSLAITWWAILAGLPGWIATAVSTLFGAPFWFDLLQRIVQVRSSGLSPTEAQNARGPAPAAPAPARPAPAQAQAAAQGG